jgi:hypothetical protein
MRIVNGKFKNQSGWVASAIALAMTVLLGSACAVYHSSDRDFFNANAIYGLTASTPIPKSASSTACTLISGDLSPTNTGNLDVMTREQDWALNHLNLSEVDVTMAKRLPQAQQAQQAQPNTSSSSSSLSEKPPRAALCNFVFSDSVSDNQAIELSKSLVENFIQASAQ